MRWVLVWSLVLLGTVGGAVTAQATELKEVIATLETPFQGATAQKGAIRDFTADFTQESRIASLDRVQHGRGQVAVKFKRQAAKEPPLTLFRWEYQEPTQQQIVSDGHTMWVYLPENNQVIRSDLDHLERSESEDPLAFLTGLGNLSRDFTIAWAEPKQDPAGNWVLALTPRRAAPMLTKLQIVVDRQAVQEFHRHGRVDGHLPLHASTVYDVNGNSTALVFQHVKVNQGLTDATFHFTVPAGTEVVSAPGTQLTP